MDLRDLSVVLPLLHTRLHPPEEAPALLASLIDAYPLARRAAVLLPLFELAGEAHLIFIRRASGLRAHSGEIAFPGGSFDHQDLSLVTTALREAAEEISLAPERVQVIGLLPPVFTVVSNFLILPVVASLPAGPGTLFPQPTEVDEVLQLPLAALADPAIAHTELWNREGHSVQVYFYDYGSLRIWGATARILASLLDRIAPL